MCAYLHDEEVGLEVRVQAEQRHGRVGRQRRQVLRQEPLRGCGGVLGVFVCGGGLGDGQGEDAQGGAQDVAAVQTQGQGGDDREAAAGPAQTEPQFPALLPKGRGGGDSREDTWRGCPGEVLRGTSP